MVRNAVDGIPEVEQEPEILKTTSMMGYLSQMFLDLDSQDPLLNDVWRFMLILSYFNKTDRDELKDLHLNQVHKPFLSRLGRFHMYRSNVYKGDLEWKHVFLKGKQTIPIEAGALADFYVFYEKFLYGMFS